jgi:hypothetical protein
MFVRLLTQIEPESMSLNCGHPVEGHSVYVFVIHSIMYYFMFSYFIFKLILLMSQIFLGGWGGGETWLYQKNRKKVLKCMKCCGCNSDDIAAVQSMLMCTVILSSKHHNVLLELGRG